MKPVSYHWGMAVVDKNQILRKLTELETHLKEIKEFSDISVEVYKEDWNTRRFVVYKDVILNYINNKSSLCSIINEQVH